MNSSVDGGQSWNQFSPDTKGRLSLSFGGVKSYIRGFDYQGREVEIPHPKLLESQVYLLLNRFNFK